MACAGLAVAERMNEDIEVLTAWCSSHREGAASGSSYTRVAVGRVPAFERELTALRKLHELVVAEPAAFASTYRELLVACPDAKMLAADAIVSR